MIHYVDQYVARMNERFFSGLRFGQLILLVVQAFYYQGEPDGHIPRPSDITIMATHGNRTASQDFRSAAQSLCCVILTGEQKDPGWSDCRKDQIGSRPCTT